MAKFNKAGAAAMYAVRRMEEHPEATTNLADGLAYALQAKTRLYTRVCTSLVGEPKFYTSGKDHDKALLADVQTVAAQDPEWILKLAAYARNEMYLRSVSTLLLAEASGIPQCKPFVRTWAPHILKRADELGEVLAYRINKYGKPIPDESLQCLPRSRVA